MPIHIPRKVVELVQPAAPPKPEGLTRDEVDALVSARIEQSQRALEALTKQLDKAISAIANKSPPKPELTRLEVEVMLAARDGQMEHRLSELTRHIDTAVAAITATAQPKRKGSAVKFTYVDGIVTGAEITPKE